MTIATVRTARELLQHPALTSPPLYPGLIKLIDRALDQMIAAASAHVLLDDDPFGGAVG